MLGVGEKFPEFQMTAVVSREAHNAFQKLATSDLEGKWKVFFFWPKDYTFVCPTEIAAYSALESEFASRNTALLGGSTDNEFVHFNWMQANPLLKDVNIPLLADVKRELTSALGIIDPNEGVAQRATFIVDQNNIIRHVMVTDLAVGRNPDETLRILDALQTGKLTPCAWNPGDNTL